MHNWITKKTWEHDCDKSVKECSIFVNNGDSPLWLSGIDSLLLERDKKRLYKENENEVTVLYLFYCKSSFYLEVFMNKLINCMKNHFYL